MRKIGINNDEIDPILYAMYLAIKTDFLFTKENIKSYGRSFNDAKFRETYKENLSSYNLSRDHFYAINVWSEDLNYFESLSTLEETFDVRFTIIRALNGDFNRIVYSSWKETSRKIPIFIEKTTAGYAPINLSQTKP